MSDEKFEVMLFKPSWAESLEVEDTGYEPILTPEARRKVRAHQEATVEGWRGQATEMNFTVVTDLETALSTIGNYQLLLIGNAKDGSYADLGDALAKAANERDVPIPYLSAAKLSADIVEGANNIPDDALAEKDRRSLSVVNMSASEAVDAMRAALGLASA